MPLPKSLTTVTTFSKIIALILFILLPFAGFYLGYKYSLSTSSPVLENNLIQTSSSVSNSIASWKTYSDKNNNYTFKYPSEWILTASNSEPCTGVYLNPSINLPRLCPGIIRVVVRDGHGLNRFDTEVGMTKDGLKLKKEDLSMNSRKVTKLYGIYPDWDSEYSGDKVIFYFVDLNYKTLEIEYLSNSLVSDYSKQFEEIVSTFKF